MAKRDKIQETLNLPFRCEKDHWSNYKKDQLILIGNIFTDILLRENPYINLLNLNQLGFFQIFIPELHSLKSIPQTKQNSKDAFHHSITAVQHVAKNHILRWAILLHDIGKSHY